MPFILRLGLGLVALVVLHVLFTMYDQLGEANRIIRELTGRGVFAYGARENVLDADEVGGDFRREYNPELNPASRSSEQDRFSKLRATGEKYNERFQGLFEQDVYTIEKRIYESNRKLSRNPSLQQNRNYGRQSTKSRRPNAPVLYPTAPFHSALSLESSAPLKQQQRRKGPVSRVSCAKVMILAYRRSGSSFLGEMFNRNPEVFYLFEPMYPIEAIAGRGKSPLLYDTLVDHLLDVIYTCSFVKYPLLVDFLSSSSFRLKSQKLRSSDLCPEDVTPEKRLFCRSLNASMLTQLCRSSSHIVFKTIRADARKTRRFIAQFISANAADFEGSDREKKPGLASLKVIHLVRDPRAIINSRLRHRLGTISRIWWESTARQRSNGSSVARALVRSVRTASSNLCSRIYSDMKHGQELGAAHYAMIRYEDVAMRPLSAYEEIYNYTNIELSMVVKQWLVRNTKTDTDLGYYSTSRNSTATVNGWRSKFPIELTIEVQKQCGQLMEVLGYLPVEDETQLKDLSQSLVIQPRSGTLLRKKPATA